MENLNLPTLIRKVNRKKLIMPVLFLCLSVFIFFSTPLHHILSVKSVNTPAEAAGAYLNGDIYIRISLKDLYYTGVNRMDGRNIHACYYYCIHEENCYYILISAKSLKLNKENSTPPAYLENYECTARLEQNPTEIAELTRLVSHALDWTSQSLNLMSGKVLINQHSMSHYKEYFLLLFMTTASAAALIHVILVIISLIWPEKSRAALRLARNGNTKDLFLSACVEYEETLPCAPGIILTNTFFIAYDKHNIHILPLDSIVWAYKFGTLHNRLFHPRISYSVSVVTNNRKHYIVHHKTKEAADAALDALQNRFPEILIGYSEGRRFDKKY